MNEDKLPQLLNELKVASNECLAAKIATYEVSKRNAGLCVDVLDELGYVPRLINRRLEKREIETDGRDIMHEDFWANEDMIIALYEHLEEQFGLREVNHAGA